MTISWSEATNMGGTLNSGALAVSSDGQYITQASLDAYKEYSVIYTTNYGSTWSEVGLTSLIYDSANVLLCMSSNGLYQTLYVTQQITTDYLAPSLYAYNFYVSTTGPFMSAPFTVSAFHPLVEVSSIAMSSDGSIQVAVDVDGNYHSSTTLWASATTSAFFGASSYNFIAVSADGVYQTVASFNTIYVSNNTGASFSLVNTTAGAVRGVAVSSSGQFQTVVTVNGYYYVSLDFGQTWSTGFLSGVVFQSVCVHASGRYQFAITSTTGVYESTDYGASWTLVSTLPSGVLYSCAISSGNDPSSTLVVNNYPHVSYGPVSTPTPVPCFLEGTQILCRLNTDADEYVQVPVELLAKGMLVKTRLHGDVPVEEIGHRVFKNPPPTMKERVMERLYRCTKKQYPELKEDLVLTGCHAVLVDHLTEDQADEIRERFGTLLVTEKKYRLMAYLDERAVPFEISGAHTVWHFALQNDSIYRNYGVYANGGLLVETSSLRYLRELSGMELLP
jgi:hypothetical protein